MLTYVTGILQLVYTRNFNAILITMVFSCIHKCITYSLIAADKVNIVGDVEGAYKVVYTNAPKDVSNVEAAVEPKMEVTYLKEDLASE